MKDFGCRAKVLRNTAGDQIHDEYFIWMTDLICDRKFTRNLSWNRLFEALDGTEFTYILEMDGNRADDGVNLRRRFGFEKNYSRETVEQFMAETPCSVFEMMVALSLHCEESIMMDPEIGDRTGKWFFEMIDSLGLCGMDDEHFDERTVQNVISKFLKRRYRRDGRGGLFTISGGDIDMRNTEIWYQLMYYLDELIYGRR